jgi:hypothetical protein
MHRSETPKISTLNINNKQRKIECNKEPIEKNQVKRGSSVLIKE